MARDLEALYMKAGDPLTIDFDDIILDFNDCFRVYHNGLYGSSYVFDEINTYNMAEFLGLNEDEKNRRVMDFYLSDDHYAGWAIPGAIEALQILSELHPLHIVTARPLFMRGRTESWLDSKGARRLFKELHFTNGYLPEVGSPPARSKAEICLEIGSAAHIEDALHHAHSVSAAGIPVFILDKPWNQSGPVEGVTRMQNWKEILKHLSVHETTPAA